MNYELTHDSIALLVYDKASTEARTRRKVERYIRELYQAYHERDSTLTQDDLDYITPYLGQVNISEEESSFIDSGRNALIQKRRNRRILVLSVILVLFTISCIALWQSFVATQEKKKAEAAQALAEKNEQQAKEAERLAILQKEIADSAKNEANTQRVVALEAKEEVQQKLDEILREKRKRVGTLLAQFPTSIEKLDFEEADQLVKEIIVVDSRPRETRLAVAELLFYYQSTRNSDKAFELAQRARHLFSTSFRSDTDSSRFVQQLLTEVGSDRGYKEMKRKYHPAMLKVKGAKFWMGSEADEKSRGKDEILHQVQLDSYQIGISEVTVLQYHIFSQATKRPMPTDFKWKLRASQPIVNVSWYDAVAYCNWLSAEQGQSPAYTNIDESSSSADWNTSASGFRLPTEAEWMFAAHGGFSNPEEKKYYRYAGGDKITPLGWFRSNSSSQIHEVKQKSPNALGLYDMSGNAWEWCWDWYDENYYQSCKDQGLVSNPRGPNQATEDAGRVNVGGGYGSRSSSCRINNRSKNKPTENNDGLGFRIARSN